MAHHCNVAVMYTRKYSVHLGTVSNPQSHILRILDVLPRHRRSMTRSMSSRASERDLNLVTVIAVARPRVWTHRQNLNDLPNDVLPLLIVRPCSSKRYQTIPISHTRTKYVCMYVCMQCNAIQCSATQRNATQRNAMQRNATQCNACMCVL